jgi:hypothetical protein
MRCRWSCFSKSRGFLLADGCGFGDRRRLGFTRVRWSALGFGLRRRRAAATARACEDATSFADVVVATVVGAIAAACLFFRGVAKAVLPFMGIATPETIRIWKLRRERWTLEDFVTRLPRDNVQCMMNRVGRKSVKKRRRSSSDTLVSWVC